MNQSPASLFIFNLLCLKVFEAECRSSNALWKRQLKSTQEMDILGGCLWYWFIFLSFSIPMSFNPFASTFSAKETPSCVRIFSVNERGRGQFQSMQSWMNQVKHPVLYNTLEHWPWPDLFFVVLQWLKHGRYCVKICSWCRAVSGAMNTRGKAEVRWLRASQVQKG